MPKKTASPANDAHLVQLVRSALGLIPARGGAHRPNVGSCKLVVTLHGDLLAGHGRAVCEVVRGVEGVRGVVCKL